MAALVLSARTVECGRAASGDVVVEESSFRILYDPATIEHLATIDRKYHSLVGRAIQEQLLHEPERETRNRKRLRQPANFGAAWELRIGPANRFRVLYRIDEDARAVRILAIGVKVGSRLLIAGKETEP